MGADLYAEAAAFRTAIDRAAAIVRERTAYDPLRAFVGREPVETKTQDLVNHGLVQLGHVELWRAEGIEPDAVLGLSLGEAAAVYAAGGLSFADAVAVVCVIGGGSAEGRSPGVMFSLPVAAADAAELCAAAPVRLDVCGTVTLRYTIVSCEAPDADAAREYLAASHTILREQASLRATHTPRAPSVRRRFADLLADVQPRPARIPTFLASAGRDVRSDAHFDARHWAWMHDHRFLYGEALDAALALRPALVVQIGPVPHHNEHLTSVARERGCAAAIVDTMRGRDEPELESWARARDAVRRARRRRRPVAPPDVRTETLDLNDPEFRRDPWPTLASLRRRGPVHRLPAAGAWLVLDRELVRDALTRPEDFSSRAWRELDTSLLSKDPPEHGRVRRQVAPLLAPSVVDPLDAHARALAHERLEARRDVSEFDVIREVAEPVVHATVEQVIGTDHGAAAVEGLDLDPETKRGLPQLLWFAGTISTVRHIAWAVLELGRDPELRAAVAAGDDALNRFLDEVLRVRAVEPFLRRETTRSVRLADVTVPAGETVLLAIGAANRDPAHYPEPDRIRLDRPPTPDVVFGNGPHRCPGARLSRVMAAAVVRALLDVAPAFEVVQPDSALRPGSRPFAYDLAELTIAPVG